MKTALLFSGQGSQYVGMMKDFYNSNEFAKNRIDLADSILGYKISDIMFDGPDDKLKETKYTQPSIFLHSSICIELLKDKIEFDAVAGHSVGEFAALYSVGVLNFEDTLKLVSLRANLMFEAGLNKPGTMFAVIGLDESKIEELCKSITANGNGKVVVPANYNSTGQVVVSGDAEFLRENASKFKEAGAKLVKELNVSGAFHSPLLNEAKEELALNINKLNFNNANKPIYSNVEASPIVDGIKIKENLISQLTSTVRWTQTLHNMYENGITNFIEIGPGNVLQGLVKRTLNGVNITGYEKLEDLNKLSEI